MKFEVDTYYIAIEDGDFSDSFRKKEFRTMCYARKTSCKYYLPDSERPTKIPLCRTSDISFWNKIHSHIWVNIVIEFFPTVV